VRRLEQQEDLVLTPFEKNLEVWRQLWRVVERSNVIVQVMLALPSYSPLSGESVPPSLVKR
jgi:ribosome biogenesis GTPase A